MIRRTQPKEAERRVRTAETQSELPMNFYKFIACLGWRSVCLLTTATVVGPRQTDYIYIDILITGPVVRSAFLKPVPPLSPKAPVPNPSAQGTCFLEDNFSMDLGWGWFLDDLIVLHLLCTLFLLLLHQIHLRSSGIRSWRLGTLPP